jgi:hypothetical protein
MSMAWAHPERMDQCPVGGFRNCRGGLWITSARVQVWADGQMGPQPTNMVTQKNGRLYDVTGTADAQSK